MLVVQEYAQSPGNQLSNMFLEQFIFLHKGNIIQLLPLSEGDMTICSPDAGNIARGRSPRVT